MGQTKRLIEHQEDQQRAAINIAVRAGVLRQCEWHADIILDGGREPEAAYAAGNARMKTGEFSGVFGTPREMTDAVKSVIEEHPLDNCPICEKMLED